MDKLKNLKYVSGAAFLVAFLMAVVIFTGYGSSFISTKHARTIFIVAGAIALFINLIGFQQGKHSPIYSLLFWGSSIFLFIGIMFKIMHWPFATYIIIAALITFAVTFFVPSKRSENIDKDEELLDNF